MAIFSQPGSCVLPMWRNVITMPACWTCSEAGEQGQGHSRHSRCAANTSRGLPTRTEPIQTAHTPCGTHQWPVCQSLQILMCTCMQPPKCLHRLQPLVASPHMHCPSGIPGTETALVFTPTRWRLLLHLHSAKLTFQGRSQHRLLQFSFLFLCVTKLRSQGTVCLEKIPFGLNVNTFIPMHVKSIN